MLELRFLGRPSILCEREPVTGFVSDKALALFVYLTLNKGSQSRQMLAGLLWGEMTEKRARANLRFALHNLRQLFPGYLEVTRKSASFVHEAPHWLDVVAFEQLAREKEDVDALTHAAELYRDDFLAGLVVGEERAFEAWWRAERERLRLELLEVMKHLADRYATQGCWREAEQATRRLLELEPWGEASHRQLMLLLARQGEYSAALAQYEHCRKLLQEELGVAPMPETQALQRRIRRLRSRPRHNLPALPLPLLGRKRELEEVGALLVDDAARLVTITGLGGVGKTRLAVEAAARQSAFFLDGIFWVPLSGVQDTGYLVGNIFRALGVESAPGQERRSRLLDFLREKELLLVLDNFEQLLEGATLLGEILQAAPAVKLLVTSRERLKLQVEHVYPLSGLSYSRWATRAEAEREAAVQLFLHHARRVWPSFLIRNEHLQPLQEIVRRVEGMPLALILASGWVEVLGPEKIAAEIGRSLDFLEGTFRDVPARQRSMRAVFQATWERLSEREQRLFAALSVFRGSFTLEAARAVTGANPRDLMNLCSRSLLMRSREGRFELHELLRQFAEERLEESVEAESVRDAHSAYYLQALAAHLPDLKGCNQLGAAQAIEADFENVRTAWRWATEHGQWELFPSATESLYLFALIRRRQLDCVELFDTARTAITPCSDSERLAYAYVVASRHALNYMGLREEALAAIPELQAVTEALSAPVATAYCQLMLGKVLLYATRNAEAIEVLEAAAAYYQQAQEPLYTALAFYRIGEHLLHLGQAAKGIPFLRRGLELSRQAGNPHMIGALLHGLGVLTWVSEGPTAEAERYYREAANLRRERGEPGYARSLAYVAKVIVWRDGDPAKARPLLEEALVLTEEQNLHAVRLYILDVLYTLLLIEGKYEEVLALTEEGLALEVHQEGDWAWSSVQRGIAFLAVGNYGEAVRFIKGGLAPMVERVGPFQGAALAFAGMLFAERGEHERAVELLATGRTQHHGIGWPENDPLLTRFRTELEEVLGEECFAAAWERGEGLDTREVTAQVLEELESSDADGVRLRG